MLTSGKWAFALLVTMAAACAHVEATRLRIRCCEGDERPNGACDEVQPFANVIMDGAAAGVCGDWGGDGRLMSAGYHHISVQIRGGPEGCCFDANLDVDLPPGKVTAVQANLGRFPD